MSNRTTSAGLNRESEEPEVSLIGDEVGLQNIDALDDDVEKPASIFHGSLESFFQSIIENRSQVSAGPECCAQAPARPCVSRVIDADGVQRICIILGPHERSEFLPLVLGLIDSASEKDVVDLTIVSNVSGEAGTISQRSILSAIDRCKGTVITRAGTLTTVGDVVIWLSGDKLLMPRIGAIFMRQPIAGYVGDTVDYERKLKDFRESLKEFSDFIVERGLFTQAEIDTMYDECGLLALYGPELQERIASLKDVKSEN